MSDLPRPPSLPPAKPPPRRSPLRELRELREKQERELRERHEPPAEARAPREAAPEIRERREAPPDTREVRETPRLVAQNDGLAVRNIGKQFKKRPVLRDVSLYVQRGEVVGLLGPNGAGKTTCFYIVTGLIAPDYGMITLDGHDITDLPMYRRSRLGVGYLPQEASI
ncbi:MAG TPA: ATP-binding cassette domain-containing protein, partial [Alphaproteobacteria bacterium]